MKLAGEVMSRVANYRQAYLQALLELVPAARPPYLALGRKPNTRKPAYVIDYLQPWFSQDTETARGDSSEYPERQLLQVQRRTLYVRAVVDPIALLGYALVALGGASGVLIASLSGRSSLALLGVASTLAGLTALVLSPKLLHPDFEQLVQEVEKARADYAQNAYSRGYFRPYEEDYRVYLPPHEELHDEYTDIEREAIAIRLRDYEPSGYYDERIMQWNVQVEKLNELRAKALLAQRSSLLIRLLARGRDFDIGRDRDME